MKPLPDLMPGVEFAIEQLGLADQKAGWLRALAAIEYGKRQASEPWGEHYDNELLRRFICWIRPHGYRRGTKVTVKRILQENYAIGSDEADKLCARFSVSPYEDRNT